MVAARVVPAHSTSVVLQVDHKDSLGYSFVLHVNQERRVHTSESRNG